MLSEYIRGAMHRAHYEILEDDGSFYGEIPGFEGVYANADTLEQCREELEEVLEEWLLFRISRDLPVPVVNEIDLRVRHEQEGAGLSVQDRPGRGQKEPPVAGFGDGAAHGRGARGSASLPTISRVLLLVVSRRSADRSRGRAMGGRAPDEARQPGGVAHREIALPLTELQQEILAIVARTPSPDSYLAGGAALHFAPNTIRYSHDLDFFHDSAERVATAFAALHLPTHSACGRPLLGRRR